MIFEFVALATGTVASGTTVDCSTSLNVKAGDLLVGWGHYNSAKTTAAIAKDSGSPANTFTFDAADENDHGSDPNHGAIGYLLSAAADATAIFRLTLGVSSSFLSIFVYQFRPTPGITVSKDTSNKGNGTGTALTSGNITLARVDDVCVACFGEASTAIESTTVELIGEVPITERAGSPNSNFTAVWDRIADTAFTGQAAATLGTSNAWILSIIAFKGTPPPDPILGWGVQYSVGSGRRVVMIPSGS